VAALGRIDLHAADFGARGIRPAVATLRRATVHPETLPRPPLLLFVYRVPRLDAAGQEQHVDLFAAIHNGVRVGRRPSRAHLEVVASMALDAVGPAVRRLAATRALARLEADRCLVDAAVHTHLAREAALADAVRAALARQVVQPGLFDRRATRAGSHTRARREAAIAAADHRARRLVAERTLRVGEAELVVVGWVGG